MSLKKSRGNKKYLEAKNNGNKTIQNLWDAVKAVLKGKFIACKATSIKRRNIKKTT